MWHGYIGEDAVPVCTCMQRQSVIEYPHQHDSYKPWCTCRLQWWMAAAYHVCDGNKYCVGAQCTNGNYQQVGYYGLSGMWCHIAAVVI